MGVDLCVCLHGSMSARVMMSLRVCNQPSPAPVPEGAEWVLKHHGSSLTLPNDYGNCDSLMLIGSVCHCL